MPKIYRHIDTNNLYKVGSTIRWSRCVGKTLEFQYEDIKGTLLITGYRNRRVSVAYKNTRFEIDRSDLLQCKLGSKIKPKQTVAEYNAELVKYFLFPEEAHLYTYGSGKKVFLKCPQCGKEKTDVIYNLSAKGFKCSACSDGISYPEKFVYNVLRQLNVRFQTQVTQKSFPWIRNRYRYDLIIWDNDDNIHFCEIHGLQHYSDGFSYYGKSFENQIHIDKDKKNLVLENNYDFFEIDFRYSTFDWGMKNVQKSKLSSIFDLSNIDWIKAHEFALSSLLLKAVKLYNNGTDIIDIAVLLNVSKYTIYSYIKQGAKAQLCNPIDKKSTREAMVKDCSKLYSSGKNQLEISSILGISISTVRKYLALGSELGISNYINRYDKFNSNLIDTCTLFNEGITCIRDLSIKVGVNTDTIVRYLHQGSKLGLCTYFTQHETRLKNKNTFLEIYRSGVENPEDIAGIMNIGRTTAYRFYRELIEDGLCSPINKSLKRTNFIHIVCKMYVNGASISEISNIIGKDRSTIRDYLISGSDIGLCNYKTDILLAKRIRSEVIYRTCSLYNNKLNISQISKELSISTTTVTKYLKIGNSLNLCNYTPFVSKSKNNKLNLLQCACEMYNNGETLNNISFKLNISRTTIRKYLKEGSILGKCIYEENLKNNKQTMNENIVKVCSLYNDGVSTIVGLQQITGLSDKTIVKYLKKGNSLGLCNYIPTLGNARNNKTALLHEACEMYNNGEKIIDISYKLNISRDTIRKYLKEGNYLGLCVYSNQ